MSQDTRSYVWASPQPGKAMDVPAGSQGEFSFRCTNDTESPVVYEPKVSGLPNAWVGPESHQAVLGPFDEREIRFLLTPPQEAELGDYPFKVSIWADGSVLDPPGERELTLRVLQSIAPPKPPEKPKVEKPPKEKPSKPFVEVAVELEPPKEPEASAWVPEAIVVPEPPAPEPPAPEPEPPPVEAFSEPEPEPPVPEPEPEPEPPAPEPEPPAPEPEPEPPAPEPEKTPIVIDLGEEEPAPAPEPPAPEPEPEPAPEPVMSVEPEEQGGWYTEGEVIKRPKPVPKTEPESAPQPVRRAARVVDLEEEDEATQAPAPQADKVIFDPKDGTVVSVRPGETALITFRFSNVIPTGQRAEARTYILQEDRALPSDWIGIVQDQVNVTPNGTGELRVLLKPPKSAEPASYPFTISTGPYGMALTPCSLILNVQAVPAVMLRTKSPKSATGPWGRNCDFELSIDNAGNADTAYRVAVKDTTVDKDPKGRPAAPDDLYESASWRYLLDKDLDSLVTPSSAKNRQPNNHRLRLHRRGVWWFGWREKHGVTVAAAPVTDIANAQKPGNAAELTAVRWRLTPLPWFLMVPLTILLLIMLGSSPSNFGTTNTYIGEEVRFVLGTELVQGPTTMKVEAKWDAPFYAWLNVEKADSTFPSDRSVDSGSRGTFSDTAEINDLGLDRLITYSVRSVVTSVGSKEDVRLVPLRTDDVLRVTPNVDDAEPLPWQATEETYADAPLKVQGREYLVLVPSDSSRVGSIRLKNTASIASGRSVGVWVARAPTRFEIQGLTTGNKSTELRARTELPVKFSYRGSDGAGDEEELWLFTTDQAHQFIRIKLRVQ